MGTSTEVRRELELLLRTRTPAVALVSWEEARALRLVKDVARILSPSREVFTWSLGQGLRQEGQAVLGVPSACSVHEALSAVPEFKGPAVFVFLDCDLQNPEVARKVRDLVASTGNAPRSLLFITHKLLLHPSLARTVAMLEVPAPDRTELKNILTAVANRCVSVVGVEVQLQGDAPDRLADAALGLSAEEAERAFIRALLQSQRLSAAEVKVVLTEKKRALEIDSLLEVVLPNERLDEVCGLDTLHGWLSRRGKAFSEESLSAGLPAPRGMLLVGMSGCGRSHVIRATAGSWQLPLVRIRAAALQSGGATGEVQLRDSLKRLEGFGPCVLWLPNLDRLFSPGSETDGGRADSPVASVMFSWLLEKSAPIFVAATADDYERIPLALIWKHAFDEVFFLDFPSSEERRQLLHALLARRGISSQEINLEMLVAASEGFSAVQIDQAIVRGMRDAFEQARPLKMVDILQSLRQMTPMAAFLGESRRKLRGWAHRRAVPASPPREN